MFRKKTRSEVISAELQEGFSHLATAATEAGRAVAEEVAPRVEAAREAAGPRIEAAQKAVTPKVVAAVAAAAPVVASARDTVVPRVEAARDAVAPRLEGALVAAAPLTEAARAAAVKAAADLAPRVEAARETLQKDVVPRLAATQAAAVAYATPKVVAALDAVVSATDQAHRELEARRDELAASAADARKKAKKKAKKGKKKAAKAATKVKRKVGVEPEPRRWPWVLAVLAVGGVAFAVLRRLRDSQNSWTPAPAGDGPVPSYREDPVPSTPSNDAAKTVSDAGAAPGDATPPDTDLGMQTAQPAPADAEDTGRDDTPGASSGETGQPTTPPNPA